MRSRLLLFLVASGMALPPIASASEYDDFRIPDHHWRRHSLAAEGRLSGSELGLSLGELSNGNINAWLNGGAEWARDSETRQHRLWLFLLAQGWRGSSESSRFQDFSDPIFGPRYLIDEQEGVTRQVYENLQLAGEWREYPGSRPWAIGLSAVADARLDQSWNNDNSRRIESASGVERRYLSLYDAHQRHYGYRVSGSAQVGYGRVRDATGVHFARVLVDRLRRDGKLARDPSGAAMQRVAALFYAEPGYAAPHDFPRRFFWRDIESALREDGVLSTEGFDAFEVLHALEPIAVAQGRFYRAAGWFVGPVITFQHIHDIYRADSRQFFQLLQADTLVLEDANSTGARSEQSDDVVVAGGAVEWHRPIGDRWQVDVQSRALFDLEGSSLWNSWVTSAGAGHLIDERWFGWLSASHDRTIDHRSVSNDRWLAAVNAGVRYYLEDRWNVGLEFAHRQSEEAFNAPHGDFRRSSSVLLRLGWDTGALDVPGLADPVRPLH